MSRPNDHDSGADQPATRSAAPAVHLPVLLLSGPPALRHDHDTNPEPLQVEASSRRLLVHRNTMILSTDQFTGDRASTIRGTVGVTGPDRVMVPLFCLAGEWPTRWRPYTLVAVRARDLVFIALNGGPVYGDPEDPDTVCSWVRDLSARHRLHGRQLNQHRQCLVDAREGFEIRRTYNLTEPGVWQLAYALHLRAVDGDIPGWTTGHDNEFEQREDAHHLFTVRAPTAERGYLMCTRLDDDTWTARRIWLSDTDEREELVDRADVRPEPDLTCAIRHHFNIEPHWEGRYWRRRYTVHLESLHTGHVFAADFAQCSTDTGHPDLYQAVIGYARSRRIGTGDHDGGLLDDFDALTNWIRAYLAELHVPAVYERHSELSWLTRCGDAAGITAARPVHERRPRWAANR